MAKKGVKSISGSSIIKAGEWTDYKVTSWYDATPANERNEAHVKWVAYHDNKGNWEKILEKEQGNFRFQEGAVGNTYLIVAYSHEPELDNASAMKVKVVSAEKREVLRVEMTDINDNKLTKALPYGRKVKAKAFTTGMVGDRILFKMWEDDAEGGGHSEENKYNLVAQAMAKVGEKGVAIVEFTLKPDFKVIANAHAGKGGEGKIHEYYVTAIATDKTKYVAGSNFDVYSKEEIEKAEKDQLTGGQKKNPKVPTKEGKIQNSPPQQPKELPPTQQKGVKYVYFTNTKNQKITTSAFGDTIKVHIVSTGLKGNEFELELYEDDYPASNDTLYKGRHTITTDDCFVTIPLTKAMYDKGTGLEMGSQELYAKVRILDIPPYVAGSKVKVEATSYELDVPDNVTKTKVEVADAPKKDESSTKKGECFCNRDIKVEELKKMVTEIRDNTFYNGKTISFYHEDKLFYLYSKVPKSDRTFEKFAEVLNNAFKKYNINTCVRKIHFLANMYVETMYFTATREGKGTSGFRYDPYRGRGFQHLTWEDNYKKYYKETGINIVDNYEMVADNLEIAANTGCWYWDKMGINTYADKDSIFDTSRLINYPGAKKSSSINGFKDRNIAYLKLKTIFEYPANCVNVVVKPKTKECQNCKTEHYDLTNKVAWQTQFDSKWGTKKQQNVACKKTCDDILNKVGLRSTIKTEKYQTALENENHTALNINIDEAKRGVKYLDLQLKEGNPIQVGVDHALNYKGGTLNEGTTDHFIIIVGKGCDNGNIYYRFYDVGTSHLKLGASEENKLYLNTSNFSLKGKTKYNGSTYTVTQIRHNTKI